MSLPRPSRASAGYTLLELMVVITVLGIMVALAVPGFSYLAANTKMKSASSNLHLALLKGRSEAVKRSANVILEVTDSSNWALGWKLGPDRDADGTLDDDEVVLDQEEMGGVRIEPRDGSNNAIALQRLVYVSTGRIQGSPTLAFNIGQRTVNAAQQSDVDVQRCVQLSANGAPYLKEKAC